MTDSDGDTGQFLCGSDGTTSDQVYDDSGNYLFEETVDPDGFDTVTWADGSTDDMGDIDVENIDDVSFDG